MPFGKAKFKTNPPLDTWRTQIAILYPDFYALISPKGFEKRGAPIPHRSLESKGGGRANPRRAGEDAPVWQAFVLGRSRYRVEKKSLPLSRRGVRWRGR